MLRSLTVLLLALGCSMAGNLRHASAQVRAGQEKSAPAATSTPSPPGYDAAIDQALSEFESGNFIQAREDFLRAHKIFPNARTLRALGKAELELKSFVDAETHLSLALASQVRPLTGAQRVETLQLLERARQHVARYTFLTEPAGATLALDGTPPLLDAHRALTLSEGEYQLEVRAEGFLPLSRPLHVVGGTDERLSLALTPAPVPELELAVQPVAESGKRSEATPLRRKWWLWTGLAAVVAGGVAAGLILALRQPAQAHASGGSTNVVIGLLGQSVLAPRAPH
jgi:hypothetical protein